MLKNIMVNTKIITYIDIPIHIMKINELVDNNNTIIEI